MRWLARLFCLVCAAPALACEDPICEVPPDSLDFTRLIDFQTFPSGYGVGRALSGVVDGKGVRFGERFLGQLLEIDTGHDHLVGRPLPPLTLLAGEDGSNLGTISLWGDNVLKGHGPRGFPDAGAVGEGSIAALFDRDQPALALDIRGGEGGTVTLVFFDRTGAPIHSLRKQVDRDTGTLTLLRRGALPDIAGFTVENADPEGLGIDNLRFEFHELMGARPLPDRARRG
ncbi:hypothetical protein [Salipiger bermudensis]|uniref:Lipoprotein n=1 Tax=Salipiger bermudensis (strain DSM 26914 / JCM 13377 / KCTC 12554 / HTCC2601) TaxID=314265 RepID=Q0FSR5_SALBH|nr:hypothetical protein [Salipiger bermudensis]EAU47188.1 hypothetical protein R2601_05678 [Salipiger bermudensis HTCC2601]MAE90394.1 hypothetical protein [Pelagibaca sp.]MBN9675184.1 hypothetical protein [Salipiger bermudensis]MCA1284167.1 hypothetical protein [Salipiger bermudensis]